MCSKYFTWNSVEKTCAVGLNFLTRVVVLYALRGWSKIISLPGQVMFGFVFLFFQEMIILSVYSSGRNGLYFPDPDEFIPSRWERDEQTGSLKGVVDPFATLPYAMGARSCIGRKIAQTQICFSLATVSLFLPISLNCILFARSINSTKTCIIFTGLPQTGNTRKPWNVRRSL